MIRRGLTLIELVVSLALLALLMAAIAQWTGTAGRLAVGAGQRLPWESAAHATLQRIGEDLLVGDFGEDSLVPRVSVESNRLFIITRSASGPVIHIYERNSKDRLVRITQCDGRDNMLRVLLHDVAEWACAIDEDAETNVRTLRVRFQSADLGGAAAFTRTWRLR